MKFSVKPRSWEELQEQAVENGLMDSARSMAESRVQPRPVNVQQVLDLGGIVFFHWRGRSFGVPPLPWKAGAQLLDAFLTAQNLGPSIGPESAPSYYRACQKMAALMWRNCRPTGMLPRAIKALGLARNPFRNASERELADLTVFFLGCRMRRSLGARQAAEFAATWAPRSQTT